MAPPKTREEVSEAGEGPATLCPGCGQTIDLGCCWCGNEPGPFLHSGHPFTPMGCVCGYAKEGVEDEPVFCPPRCECERCLPEGEPTRAEFLSGSERAEMAERQRGHGPW